jgi:hypothetical protein
VKCPVCSEELDPAAAGPYATHPGCIQFSEPFDEDPFARRIKNHLISMIKWADRENPRSKQQEVGPSEIGDPCDRRVAYRIAGVPEVNTDFDPWAAIVGTAIHSWLDEAITAYTQAHLSKDWITETPVTLSEFVKGRSDLYWVPEDCVIDHKGAGPDVMKKLLKNGPGPGYVIQVQCYGYGYEQLGYPVKKVALAFYPRAGWLRDMYVWTADYDPSVAVAALTRLSAIATELLNRNILSESNRWSEIPAEPSNSCGFCPWYQPDRDPEKRATASGCPGR